VKTQENANRIGRATDTFHTMMDDRAHDDGPVFETSDCVRSAIIEATQVRITPEIVAASRYGALITAAETREIIEAAFTAAGFEVVQ
jgi:hypothetical protein